MFASTDFFYSHEYNLQDYNPSIFRDNKYNITFFETKYEEKKTKFN